MEFKENSSKPPILKYEDVFLRHVRCPECDFEFEIDQKNLFYYNHKTRQTINFDLNLENIGTGFNPLIKGQVKNTYCPHCDRSIRIYSINEINCSHYNEKNILKLVRDGINEHLEVVKQNYLNKIENLKSNREFNFLVKEYDTTFLIESEYPECFVIIDINKFPSKTEALIEGYTQIKQKFNAMTEARIKEIFDECIEIQNICHIVEIDLESYDEMINAISLKSQKIIPLRLPKKETINCPTCGNTISKQLYADIPCPKCSNKLLFNEEFFMF